MSSYNSAFKDGQEYEARKMNEENRSMLELIAQFAVLIGARWDVLYEVVKDSVELTYYAITWAEEFLALWESGYLDQEDEWLSHIDEYFEVKFYEICPRPLIN